MMPSIHTLHLSVIFLAILSILYLRVANEVKYFMLNTESLICLQNSAYYLMPPQHSNIFSCSLFSTISLSFLYFI
uniref:Predicted protein n=1 Tax=Hordeum vulgare subsp. vulgare TaxID=112509 RepID=F2D461_HORVV|nr:predicted protein [Hordeum vulgare subsp. vulgare]BAJ97588.1 predicted protein [Hordeum vulgare subsp. vulgare]